MKRRLALAVCVAVIIVFGMLWLIGWKGGGNFAFPIIIGGSILATTLPSCLPPRKWALGWAGLMAVAAAVLMHLSLEAADACTGGDGCIGHDSATWFLLAPVGGIILLAGLARFFSKPSSATTLDGGGGATDIPS